MKTIIKFIFIFSVTIGLTNCSDDIIEKEPLDEVSPENLLQTEGGFRTALDGVYGIMQEDFLGYNFCIYSIPEAINDDIIAGDPNGFTFENTHADIYPLAYDATTFQIEGFWRESYKAINNVNAIIKVARTSSLANKDAFLAEALGIRAMLYYNLYRFFAPAYNTDANALAIPYKFETEALLDTKPRNTNQEVIDFVLNDLLEAASLAENDVNSYRMSKTAIEALTARVYHETNDFSNAITYAERALTDGRYMLDTDATALQNQWQQDDSNEIIFRIRFEESDVSFNAALLSIPLFFSFPYFVSDDLINLYDQTNDIRFATYFEPEPFGSGAFYPIKHAGTRTADAATFNPGAIDIKLIRVPELHLILAEAFDKTGNAGMALNHLNILRNARGLGDYVGSDLSNEILDERRRELAFEGFRFTDLKRLGLGFTRPDGTSLAPNADRFALPIPQLEIDRSGLDQNDGY
ncbi:RagB/SusD family nutrient uptake outer membrane protein [Hyunsoonleella ulvae]|uniref:RagB/SusD family nutrient uptake outer membrane protein n=1 Tax=Hyunsoonleella ulvae TaxID=2799948 RepID=UPI00193AAAA0|nr:RagB/SusD family nutrient uptake outer membrane protein [Hyunsoonleella ulvae]